MEFDMNLGKQFVDELLDFWQECSRRCDKIEELLKKINESKL